MRVGKAKRAHHFAPRSVRDGGHVASLLCLPYEEPRSGVSKDEATGGKALCLPRLASSVLLSRPPQGFSECAALLLRLARRG